MLPPGPLVALKILLHLDHGRRTSLRGGEHREEAIALGAEFPPGVGREPRSNDPMVISENLGVIRLSEATEKRGRTLDVGEKEGERFRRSKNRRQPARATGSRIRSRPVGLAASWQRDVPGIVIKSENRIRSVIRSRIRRRSKRATFTRLSEKASGAENAGRNHRARPRPP